MLMSLSLCTIFFFTIFFFHYELTVAILGLVFSSYLINMVVVVQPSRLQDDSNVYTFIMKGEK